MKKIKNSEFFKMQTMELNLITDRSLTTIEFNANSLEFLTIQQLATLLQLKDSHIRKMIFFNEIPYFKIGRLVRFRGAEIEAWLKDRFINTEGKV